MHNQHAGLSQALAEQRMTERREQAAHAPEPWHRPADPLASVQGAPLGMTTRGCWQLIRWPAVAAE